MNQDPEIDWLLEHRPDPAAPSPIATELARAALLAHGAKQKNRRRAGRLATGMLVAACVAGAVLIIRPDHPASEHGGPRLAIAPRSASPSAPVPSHRGTPLVRLAADVRRLRFHRQTGNATLVVRYTVLAGHHSIHGEVYGGYDLYTDSGHYYWAPDSLAQLQRVVRDGLREPGDEARALRRIAAAAGKSPAQARRAVLGDPDLPAAAPNAKNAPGPPQIIDVRARDDSVVWLNATQALAAGAGRPNVRAACIKALDTLHGVREQADRIGKARALRVSYPDGSEHVAIWLDARTGVPIQERDGDNSTTSYAVERVNAHHLPARVSIHAHLR